MVGNILKCSKTVLNSLKLSQIFKHLKSYQVFLKSLIAPKRFKMVQNGSKLSQMVLNDLIWSQTVPKIMSHSSK